MEMEKERDRVRSPPAANWVAVLIVIQREQTFDLGLAPKSEAAETMDVSAFIRVSSDQHRLDNDCDAADTGLDRTGRTASHHALKDPRSAHIIFRT